MLAMLRSIRQDSGSDGELDAYLARDFGRFVRTLDLCRDQRGTCLEIGASPYFNSVLLREYGDPSLAVTRTNYFGPDNGAGVDYIAYASRRFPDLARHALPYDHFNIETDRCPYPDASFDMVLLCEVLEHLTCDPLPALREIARVLKPGGRLVLTTPNVASLRNMFQIFRGQNIHDRYSGYGAYGRHNREYTLPEVEQLLAHCGFVMDRAYTANVRPDRNRKASAAIARALIRLFSRARARTLGAYIFIAATRQGDVKPGRPDWLFRSFTDQG